MKKNKRFLFILGLFFVVFGLSGCNKNQYPNASNAFYINDYARVLTAEVKDYILSYSSQLYEITQDKGDGATPVVVATFLIDNEEEMNTYRREEIYNQWGIGENDMGLLILLYYIDVPYEGYTLPEFTKFEVAIGSRMIQYINEIDLGISMYDTIFPLYDDEELGLIHYYFEALKRIMLDAYPGEFELFDYQDELDSILELFEYEEYTFDSMGARPHSYLEDLLDANGLGFLLGGSSTAFLIGLAILFLGGAGGMFFRNRGAGGRSGGGGIFRRRR